MSNVMSAGLKVDWLDWVLQRITGIKSVNCSSRRWPHSWLKSRRRRLFYISQRTFWNKQGKFSKEEVELHYYHELLNYIVEFYTSMWLLLSLPSHIFFFFFCNEKEPRVWIDLYPHFEKWWIFLQSLCIFNTCTMIYNYNCNSRSESITITMAEKI